MPKVKSAKTTRQHNEIQKQGITFNKILGQHILKNPLVITSMVEKVNLRLNYGLYGYNLPTLAGCIETK